MFKLCFIKSKIKRLPESSESLATLMVENIEPQSIKYSLCSKTPIYYDSPCKSTITSLLKIHYTI